MWVYFCFKMSENKTILLLVITRLFDGLSTYLATPDLKMEMNPLVAYFGLGWSALIAAGIVVLLALIFLLKYSLKREYLFDFHEETIQDYASVFLFQKKITYLKMFISLPNSPRFLTYLGRVIPQTIIWYSIFLTVNNLFMFTLNFSSLLMDFYQSNFDLHTILILIMPIIILSRESFILFKQKHSEYSQRKSKHYQASTQH